nr:hypothetical protein BaRGS_016237 [Batillaria attramentaria]
MGRTLVVTDGNYSVGPDGYGEYWLNSGPFILRHNGHTLDTDSGGLHLRNYTTASSGIDKLGRWQDTVFRMETQGVLMEARMITYPLDNPDIVVFQQRFPQGLKGCKAASVNMTISGFPTFRMEQIPVNSSLGYLMFNGYMMGTAVRRSAGPPDWWVSGPPDVAGGLDGSGPLVLYDTQGGVILISPMDQLMAASVWLDGDVLAWGIMGGVDNLPPGFQFQTLLYTGTSGVGQAFKEWGRVLRQWYGKTSDVVKYHQEQDITLTHLGYWTDNGAYYYYHTETDKDYAATLNDVRQDAKTRSKNTTYAKQNGGQFDFFIGQNLSLPTSQAFWDWLLKTSSEWGLVLYEQDWLNKQLLETELLWTSLTAGSDWLDSMARAARDNNMKIQCCADDGLILKPSRPATAIDAMFHEMSFGEGSGTSGEVWSTYTDFGDFMRFGIIFTANVTRPFNVTPTNVGFSPMIPQFPDSVLFARDTPDLLRTFTDRAPFDITNSTCSSSRAPDFCLFYTAPVLTVSGVKLVVQGELAKWVPMSTQRVLRLTVTSSSVSLTLRGQPGETITFFYTLDARLV